jgi:hypothetical protein
MQHLVITYNVTVLPNAPLALFDKGYSSFEGRNYTSKVETPVEWSDLLMIRQ